MHTKRRTHAPERTAAYFEQMSLGTAVYFAVTALSSAGVCVCVCVCLLLAWLSLHTHTHAHTHVCMYIYRERERE